MVRPGGGPGGCQRAPGEVLILRVHRFLLQLAAYPGAWRFFPAPGHLPPAGHQVSGTFAGVGVAASEDPAVDGWLIEQLESAGLTQCAPANCGVIAVVRGDSAQQAIKAIVAGGDERNRIKFYSTKCAKEAIRILAEKYVDDEEVALVLQY